MSIYSFFVLILDGYHEIEIKITYRRIWALCFDPVNFTWAGVYLPPVLNCAVWFKAWPALNMLCDQECHGMYFLPCPSSDYCLPPCQVSCSVWCLDKVTCSAAHHHNRAVNTFLRCPHRQLDSVNRHKELHLSNILYLTLKPRPSFRIELCFAGFCCTLKNPSVCNYHPRFIDGLDHSEAHDLCSQSCRFSVVPVISSCLCKSKRLY